MPTQQKHVRVVEKQLLRHGNVIAVLLKTMVNAVKIVNMKAKQIVKTKTLNVFV